MSGKINFDSGAIYRASISRRLKWVCFGPAYINRKAWTDAVCKPVAYMVAIKGRELREKILPRR